MSGMKRKESDRYISNFGASSKLGNKKDKERKR